MVWKDWVCGKGGGIGWIEVGGRLLKGWWWVREEGEVWEWVGNGSDLGFLGLKCLRMLGEKIGGGGMLGMWMKWLVGIGEKNERGGGNGWMWIGGGRGGGRYWRGWGRV